MIFLSKYKVVQDIERRRLLKSIFLIEEKTMVKVRYCKVGLVNIQWSRIEHKWHIRKIGKVTCSMSNLYHMEKNVVWCCLPQIKGDPQRPKQYNQMLWLCFDKKKYTSSTIWSTSPSCTASGLMIATTTFFGIWTKQRI